MPIDLDDRASALENEYFHRQEQELLAKMKAKMEAENAEASALQCPKCDGKLVEMNYENIKIDTCRKCQGVWLDPGELARVVRKDEGGWFSNLFN